MSGAGPITDEPGKLPRESRASCISSSSTAVGSAPFVGPAAALSPFGGTSLASEEAGWSANACSWLAVTPCKSSQGYITPVHGKVFLTEPIPPQTAIHSVCLTLLCMQPMSVGAVVPGQGASGDIPHLMVHMFSNPNYNMSGGVVSLVMYMEIATPVFVL